MRTTRRTSSLKGDLILSFTVGKFVMTRCASAYIAYKPHGNARKGYARQIERQDRLLPIVAGSEEIDASPRDYQVQDVKRMGHRP